MSVETEVATLQVRGRAKTVFWVAAVAVLLLTPFSINNLLEHSYLLGFGSLLVIAILVFNSWISIRGLYYPLITLLVLVPAIITFLAYAFYKQGIIGALWCYPAVISFYFLLPERQAWLANAALLLMALPASWLYLEPSLASRVIATLLCVSTFSVIFLRIITSQQTTLQELAMTDVLTGLANRVLLHSTLEQTTQQFERSETPMSIIMLDLDHFKNINDELGHAAGDRVLKGIGELLSERIRRSDKVFRIGGEEFLIMLFDTRLEQAFRVAEALRLEIASTSFITERKVTISAGIAELEKGEHWRDWMKRGDDNLYCAKKEGRNRVIGQ